jgi:hypothetical protein
MLCSFILSLNRAEWREKKPIINSKINKNENTRDKTDLCKVGVPNFLVLKAISEPYHSGEVFCNGLLYKAL